MTTINPIKRRRLRREREAREKAETKAYWALRQPIYDKYMQRLQAEEAKHRAEIEPLEAAHATKMQKIYEEELAELNALEQKQ